MPVFGSSHGYNTGAGGNMEEMNSVEGGSVLHINPKEENIAETRGDNAGLESRKAIDFLPLRTHEPGTDMAQPKMLSAESNEVIMANPSARIGDVASGSQMPGLEVALASEVQTVKQCAAPHGPVPNLSLGVEEESKVKMKMDDSTSAPPVEKLESTAENDLHLLVGKDACGQSEEEFPRDKFVPLGASPTNSRIRLGKRKGKEKALSNGDVNERMSKDEDDSHESVESCNSAGNFSTGKKRWGFEQQLVAGSKRVKKQIEESPASTSFVRQDSSFMNWISNMVKGLNKSNQDEDTTFALTLSHRSHGHRSHDHKIVTFNGNKDPGSRNMGFRTIFQSLYCSNPKEQETRMSNIDYPTGGSKELVLDDKTCGLNITPIACHGENNNFYNQFLQSSEKFNKYRAGPSVKPETLSANVATAPGICETNSSYNKNSSNSACSKVKYGRSSSCSSLGKCKTDSAENDTDPTAARKVINNVGYRSDPRGSLWITRFSPKAHGAMSNLYHGHQNSSGALDSSTDCTRPILQTHNPVDVPIRQSIEINQCSKEDPADVVGKELQSYSPNAEASFGFKKIYGLNDQKSIYKLNPILPSPKYKSSEAMASMFARRLDALKHIKPSDAKDDATHAMTTCFYCGRSGHDLRNCSEIIETERENLIRNVSSSDGADESQLCIRCFQHDHWAISCPMASSSRQHQSEHGAALGNRFSASKMQLTIGNERYPRMLETQESDSQVANAHHNCDEKNSKVGIDLSLNSKWNELISSNKRISYPNEVQKLITLTPGDNMLKKINSLNNVVDKKFSDVPKGMFDAIKKLRLSRMDILKWKNSDTSLSHLDGFFLRLRLGKWEGGLGETGYYVACITGEQREKSQGQKDPLSVSIGGIRCFVESQYISNQDFLEDELTAWWCATLRSDGKIPTEDYLKTKLEERKRLGF